MSRVPPHSVDAERMLIAAALLDASVVELADDMALKPDHIYTEAHRQIWQAIVKLRRRKEAVDVLAIAGAMEGSRSFESFGGVGQLIQLVGNCPSAAGYKSACNNIRRLHAKREMIDLGHQLISEAERGEPRLGPLFDRFTSAADGMVTTTPMPRQLPISDVCEQLRRRLADVHAGTAPTPYIPTPFDGLNELFDGWRVSHLNAIAGENKAGKTSLGMQCAVWHARQGDGVVVATGEMPPWQLLSVAARREVAIGMTERDLNEPRADKWFRPSIGSPVKRESLTGHEAVGAVLDMIEELSELPIRFVPSVETGRGRIDQMIADVDLAIDAAPFKTRIVLVDYWQLVKPVYHTPSRPDLGHADVSERLKDWAGTSNDVAVLLLAQLKGSGDDAKKKGGRPREPRLFDLEHSKRLSKDCGTAVLIDRPNCETHQGKGAEPCKLIVDAKGARFGRGGRVECFFDGPNMRFLQQDPGGEPWAPF